MLTVRRERPEDAATARAVQSAAFGRNASAGVEPPEAGLLDALRRCDGWIDQLSLVAMLDGVIVGHNVCTRAHVGVVPVLGMGPIGVRPDVQRSGVGLALVHAMIGAADALDEPLIGLLGSPAYYGRFGFVPATDLGIEPPDPAYGVHFQALPLSAHRPSITGRFAYATPFDDLP